MAADRRITFHRSSPPYEPGDTAGFPALHARRLVDRGVASYTETEERPDFGAMSRAELVRYAVDVLGFDDEPPAEVTDEELRAGLIAQLGGDAGSEPEPAPVTEPPASTSPTGPAK